METFPNTAKKTHSNSRIKGCLLSENNHPPPKSDTVGAETRMGKAISSSQTGRGGGASTTSLAPRGKAAEAPLSSTPLLPGSGRQHA